MTYEGRKLIKKEAPDSRFCGTPGHGKKGEESWGHSSQRATRTASRKVSLIQKGISKKLKPNS